MLSCLCDRMFLFCVVCTEKDFSSLRPLQREAKLKKTFFCYSLSSSNLQMAGEKCSYWNGSRLGKGECKVVQCTLIKYSQFSAMIIRGLDTKLLFKR